MVLSRKARRRREGKCKLQRPTPYSFTVGAEKAKFQKTYYDELGRLRLAHRIAELREQRGLTQAELAEMVGITQAGISRLENPKNHNYSPEDS